MEEPKGPGFVLEVFSSSTWETALGPKRALYASLGVAEYWLLYPTREHPLSPQLQGMRLAGREYRELPVLQLAATAPTLRSEVLGLDLRLDRGALRFRDSATGEDLLSHEEMVAAQQESDAVCRAGEVRVRGEAAAQEAAEARVAELKAQLRDLPGGSITPRDSNP